MFSCMPSGAPLMPWFCLNWFHLWGKHCFQNEVHCQLKVNTFLLDLINFGCCRRLLGLACTSPAFDENCISCGCWGFRLHLRVHRHCNWVSLCGCHPQQGTEDWDSFHFVESMGSLLPRTRFWSCSACARLTGWQTNRVWWLPIMKWNFSGTFCWCVAKLTCCSVAKPHSVTGSVLAEWASFLC